MIRPAVPLLLAAAASTNNDAYLVAAIVLGIIGLLILAIELFIPSGGLLPILCAVAFISSVVAMFMWSPFAGTLLTAGYLVAAPFALTAFLHFWAKSPLVRRYTLRDGPGTKVIVDPNARDGSQGVDPDDPDAAQAASDHARRGRLRELDQFIGQVGVAETPLRPVGFVRIGERRLDAGAESGLIEPGTPVRVVAVVDGTLKVRPATGA